MEMHATLSDAAAKVSEGAIATYATVIEHSGRTWTLISTNAVATWDKVVASVTAAWVAAHPAITNFGTWAANYQFEVAVVVTLTVIATLATRAIWNHLL